MTQNAVLNGLKFNIFLGEHVFILPVHAFGKSLSSKDSPQQIQLNLI